MKKILVCTLLVCAMQTPLAFGCPFIYDMGRSLANDFVKNCFKSEAPLYCFMNAGIDCKLIAHGGEEAYYCVGKMRWHTIESVKERDLPKLADYDVHIQLNHLDVGWHGQVLYAGRLDQSPIG